MPLHLQTPSLLPLLSAVLVSGFLVPILFFSFALIILFLSVVVIPCLWAFIPACAIFDTMSLGVKLFAYLSTKFSTASSSSSESVATSSSSITKSDEENIDENRIEKHDSVELDQWELPSFSESEEDVEYIEKEVREEDKGERLCSIQKGSWLIVSPANRKIEEYKSFDEILSFWRKKEEGIMEEDANNG